jgi:hypothetical protein
LAKGHHVAIERDGVCDLAARPALLLDWLDQQPLDDLPHHKYDDAEQGGESDFDGIRHLEPPAVR